MTDYHVHTSLCDGADTPAEMAEEAYKKGFAVLGFSGHCYIDYDDYCMTKENTAFYNAEIERLKKEYDGKMEILCGIEQDYFSDMPTDIYDYVIGSVHSLSKDAATSVDGSPEVTKKLVDERFGGSFDRLAEEFFKIEADVVRKTNCDIIGHFDLVSKYKDVNGYTLSKRYFDAAFSALHELIKYDRVFEINVGAMTRSCRTDPYPSEKLLKEINALGGRIMINGDCHNRLFLGRFLDDAKELAVACGFRSQVILTKDGFKEIEL